MSVRCFLVAVGLASLLLGRADRVCVGQDQATPDRPVVKGEAGAADRAAVEDELTKQAVQVLASLRRTLADDSEARVMLDDILQGRRLGPEDGWFRVAVAQNRYDWSTVAGQYDRNGDGTIMRNEFPGSNDDYSRVDRNGDKSITAEDLDWKEHSLAQSPATTLFAMADADTNGKISRDEFVHVFGRLDRDQHGFLSLDDLREQLQAEPRGGDRTRPDRPSRSTLILGLANQEIGSLQPGPALNDPAPDFTLRSLDGADVTLSQQIGQQPVVLIFGNFTCGPFRSHSGNIEKLYQRYRDRAKFYLVYVREAHPSDGWWMLHNQNHGIDVAQPKTDEQRCDVAGLCRDHLQLDLPFLVDDVSDSVGGTYSGMPNRLYLIDSDGRVAYKSGRGPFGFKPGELEQALIWLLSVDR